MSFCMIVSPAKKMVVNEGEPAARQAPRFLDEAQELAEELRRLGPAGAQEVWRCSDRLAKENWDRVRTLPEDLRLGVSALTAAVSSYRGIQYTHLAPEVMDGAQLSWLSRHLRIVSGLYGLLRPFDAIAPYRLEMQARLSVGGSKSLYEFWDSRIYDALACERGITHIVNVASQEYAKAVLPWALPDGPKIVTCSFMIPRAKDGRLTQPSTEAKAARGSFVRWAAERQVEDVQELKGFAERGYAFSPERSGEKAWSFVRA